MFRRNNRRQRSKLRRPRFERLEDRRLLTAAWQNPVDALDVEASEVVSPIDALLVSNELNAIRERTSRIMSSSSPPPFKASVGFASPTKEF